MILRFAKRLLNKLHQVYKEQQEGIKPDHALLFDVVFDLHKYFSTMEPRKREYTNVPAGVQFEMTGETIREAYESRAKELESALSSKDEQQMMIAIDNAINTFHRMESALSHIHLEGEGWFKREKLSPLYTELLQFLKDQGKMVNPEMFEMDLDNYEVWVYGDEERERIREEKKRLFGGLRFARADWAFVITPEGERWDMDDINDHDAMIAAYCSLVLDDFDWDRDYHKLNLLHTKFMGMGGAAVRYMANTLSNPQLVVRFNSRERRLGDIVNRIMEKPPIKRDTQIWISDDGTQEEYPMTIEELLDV